MRPAFFSSIADDKSEVFNPTGVPDDVIVAAARSCPAKAITVVNEDTGAQTLSAAEEIGRGFDVVPAAAKKIARRAPGVVSVEQTLVIFPR